MKRPLLTFKCEFNFAGPHVVLLLGRLRWFVWPDLGSAACGLRASAAAQPEEAEAFTPADAGDRCSACGRRQPRRNERRVSDSSRSGLAEIPEVTAENRRTDSPWLPKPDRRSQLGLDMGGRVGGGGAIWERVRG